MRGIDIAEYVLEQAKKSKQSITNLKLQKTLYYLQGYSFRELSCSVIDDDFFNWQYGPVLPSVYFEYNVNGSNPLQRRDWIPLPHLSAEQKNISSRVIEECLRRDASELVTLSHSEDPWKNTQLWEKISEEAIRDYFTENNPLNLCF